MSYRESETVDEWREWKRPAREVPDVPSDLWAHGNLLLLRRCGHSFRLVQGDSIALFREPGMPRVDFYLHTGRWRCGHETRAGGASEFLKWYAEIRKEFLG